MSGYRFCRSDDIPLLVRAYNRCYRVEGQTIPPLTEERFKRDIRELNLWTSSCMVASSGEDPIGVLLAAKRETENWIFRLGVHPDHRRRGHGRHLLTSLSQKLAILGPTRLLAEVPGDWTESRAFIEACGYRAEATFVDFSRPPDPGPAEAHELVIPITLDDLIENDVVSPAGRRCWERAPETLINVKAGLQGFAVAAGERIEAYLLYRDPAGRGEREVQAFACREPERTEQLLGLLFSHCGRTTQRPLTIPKASSDEIRFELLESFGFEIGDETVGYAAEATSG